MRAQLHCGGWGMMLRLASKPHPGNGVAGTTAFPNGVWEREVTDFKAAPAFAEGGELKLDKTRAVRVAA